MFNRRWMPLNALRAFEAVGRQRSFTSGAQAIGVTQSAVSRHVAALESLLGQRLLLRKAQGVELTPAGEALLPVIGRSFDRIEQVLSEIRATSAPKGRTLRVHFPPSFLQQVAMPMLAEFRAEYPDLQLDIFSTNPPGRPLQDCDAAVVYDQPQVTDQISDLLWLTRLRPVCSPAMAAAFDGLSLDQVLARGELLHVRVDGRPKSFYWSAFARRFGLDLDSDRGLYFDTLVLAVRYAMAGGGIALADINMFAEEIADGRLVAPFPQDCEDGYGYYLTLAAEDLDDPVIAAFRNWIIARFAGRRRAGDEGIPQPPARAASTVGAFTVYEGGSAV